MKTLQKHIYWILAGALVMVLFMGQAIAEKDPTPPNPNRDYYNAQGQQFHYNGKPVKQVKPPKLPKGMENK